MSGENIKVVVRCKPLSDLEIEKSSTVIVNCVPDNPNAIKVSCSENIWKLNSVRAFTFDYVCGPDHSQEEMYLLVGKPAVKDVINGYNSTVFAYGQTASGKTHTIEGDLDNKENQGILPRMINDIFEHIYSMDVDLEFHIKISYFEVYLEKIRDLLDVNKTNLVVKEDKGGSIYVKGVTERFVSSPDEVFQLILQGNANRQVSVTNMNEHSSRSHSIFLIGVRQRNISTSKQLHGKLYIIDLAGSERVSKTGMDASSMGETKHINRSLSSLASVINAIVEGAKYIPYRDSKLTRILQESLGGNSRTTMVICVSSASYNESETRISLMFGERVKSVKNKIKINIELTAEDWQHLYEKEKLKCKNHQEQLHSLENEIVRWRNGDVVPRNEWMDIKDARLSICSEKVLDPISCLDNKEELIDQLRSQVEELQETEKALLKKSSAQESEILQLQTENAHNKNEANDLFLALEELANNYSQKTTEIDATRRELETAQKLINSLNSTLCFRDSELQKTRETVNGYQKGQIDIYNKFLMKLSELADIICHHIPKPTLCSPNDTQDDGYTLVRLYIDKLKYETEAIKKSLIQLHQTQDDLRNLVEKHEKTIRTYKVKTTEYNFNTTAWTNRLNDLEEKKSLLENQLYSTKCEMSSLRASNDTANSQAQDQKLQTQREELLRNQIDSLERNTRQMQDNLNNLLLENDQLRTDLDSVTSECFNYKSRLEVVTMNGEERNRSRWDTNHIEAIVFEELQKLHNLRKLFVANLDTMVDNSPIQCSHDPGISKTESIDAHLLDDDDLSVVCRTVLKERITFLESNLEQLTEVHKELVRNNAELRRELLKLEKRHTVMAERVTSLQQGLREAKETLFNERQLHKAELKHKHNASSSIPRIVKSIMAGCHPNKSKDSKENL